MKGDLVELEGTNYVVVATRRYWWKWMVELTFPISGLVPYKGWVMADRCTLKEAYEDHSKRIGRS